MALEATIEQINTQTITAQGETKKKYGFKVKEWQEDEWVNVVDWDGIYDNQSLSQGDIVTITEPEFNSKYNSWEANFVDPHQNDNGTQGYPPAEQAVKYLEHRVIPGLAKIYEKLEQIEKRMDSNDNVADTPEEVDEAFAEYAETDDEEIEDFEW